MERSGQQQASERESEMPDPELREAMAQSLQEMSRDRYETPNTGGSSGSGRAPRTTLYQGVAPARADTPNTQSEGEGSVLPNRPPRISAEGVPRLVPRPMFVADQRMVLEGRIKKEKPQIRALLNKMENMDQEFTEEDMHDLNVLKQSVKACQKDTGAAIKHR